MAEQITSSAHDRALEEMLAGAAVLEAFDAQSLAAVTTIDRPGAPAQLLDAGLATRSGDEFVLDTAARVTALERLSATPERLLELHGRAAGYFLRRLQTGGDAGRQHLEGRYMHHVAFRCDYFIEHTRIEALSQELEQVRSDLLRDNHNLQRLAYYRGLDQGLRQEYTAARNAFRPLLADPTLPDTLRLRVLNSDAVFARYCGDYDGARERYEQCNSLAEKTGDRRRQALALMNAGNLSFYTEDYAAAEQALDASIELFGALGQHERVAQVRVNRALVALYQGQWDEAAGYAAQAKQPLRDAGYHDFLARLINNEGELLLFQGAYERALVSFVEAAAMMETDLHRVDVQVNLGLLHHIQGNDAEALRAYTAALDLAQRCDRHEISEFLLNRIGHVHYRLGNHEAALNSYTMAIAQIEARRTPLRDENLQIRLTGLWHPVYEGMVGLCIAQGRHADAFHYAERGRARALLSQLISRSPELLASVQSPVATLADVQAALPPGAVLLVYYCSGLLPRGAHVLNALTDKRLLQALVLPPSLVVFAVTRAGAEVHRLELDPNVLRPEVDDPGPGRRLLNGRWPAFLYRRLIAPVEHLLAGAEQLLIVPHGPLHYVPFAALRDANERFLARRDGPTLAVAPSATILLRTGLAHQEPRRRTARDLRMLALGYNDAQARLHYSEAEARAAAQLMGGESITGGASKRARLRRQGRHARLIHFAGHAHFSATDPLGSSLQLGKDDALSAREIMQTLRLDADVVTLSACVSGLSHVASGDELLGLQRALLYAGARAIVCTLWETADLLALVMMERFYTELRAGSHVAAALRDAQLAIRELSGAEVAGTLERWRPEVRGDGAAFGAVVAAFRAQGGGRPFADPLYWAPFIVVGGLQTQGL